jgi:Ca2+-binding RTX toxin-like protein
MADLTTTPESGEQPLSLNAGDGESLTLPEGFDLTSAEFEASGDDLIVTAPDGSRVVVEDYYSQENPPELVSPDGAQLSGEMIVQLAEGPTGGDVAAGTDGASSAAGSPEGSLAANPTVITGTDGEPIGNVENLEGQVFAVRADGTRVELNVGDPVYQGDIIESGPDGSIGVLLADETTFSMGESGRMVLDEMIYDPSTQEGSVSMTALQGVFTFVSGQVAKTDPDAMTLDTPVATIGIRGTQVGLDISDGQNMNVVLMEEADGFVGEVVVMNDAGVQVLNGANQMTGITGFQIAPTEIRTISEGDVISQFESALRRIPKVHGNQNDFGLQDQQNEEQLLDEEIQQLEKEVEAGDAEASAEDLANFETAAGQEEQQGETADIQVVSDELTQMKILDPVSAQTQDVGEAADGEGEDNTDAGNDDEAVAVDTAPVPPAGAQFVTGPNGQLIEVPEEIGNASYNSETGMIEGNVDGDLDLTNSPYSDLSYNLTGSDGSNIIHTGSGDDIISGTGGDDYLVGGTGNDTVSGGAGDDVVAGGEGDDVVSGGEGDDVVVGGDIDQGVSVDVSEDGDVTLSTTTTVTNEDGETVQVTTTTEADDSVIGAGNDTLYGDEGEDILIGGAGDDYLDGGDGDDVLVGGTGDDTIVGGAGDDRAFGGEGADTISGGEGNDYVSGGEGDDFLEGNEGEDTMIGGAGNDVIDGGLSDDILQGGDGDDTLIGGEGNDTMDGGAGNDLLFGNEGEDIMDGGEGNDFLDGGLSNDTMTGGAGNDILEGGAGNDVIDGGEGDDLIVGGELGDDVTAVSVDAEGTVTLTMGTDEEGAPITVTADEITIGSGLDTLGGGAGDDIVIGGFGSDMITGGDGNDVLVGGFGNDTLEGGSGDDSAFGGQGDDVFIGGAGSDTLVGGDGLDTVDYSNVGEGFGLVVDLIAGQAYDAADSAGPWIDLDTLSGIENVVGGAGDDVIIGDAGGNTLDGGGGDDYIEGGYGDDVLIGGAGNNVLVGGHGDDIARFDGALADFGIQLIGEDFTVTNGATGETTVLQGIEQLDFITSDGIVQNVNVVEMPAVEDQPFELNLLDVIGKDDGSGNLSLPEGTETVLISGYPEGTTLEIAGQTISAGEDGSFELGANQTSGIVVHLPEDYGEEMLVTVEAQNAAGEPVGQALINLDLEAVADMAHIEAVDVAGGEDIPIGLNMDATLMDMDGSETLSITLSGVPFGAHVLDVGGNLVEGQGFAVLTSIYTATDEAGNEISVPVSIEQDPNDGTFTIDSAELGISPEQMSQLISNMTLTPALHHDEDFTVTVEATVTDSNGDTETMFTTATGGDPVDHLTFDVEVYDRADAPVMEMQDAQGFEDGIINLDVSAMTVDPSETLSITVSGIPAGAKFFVEYTPSVGEPFMVQLPVDASGSVSVPSGFIGSNFAVQPPADSNEDFDLTVTATAYEPDATEVGPDGQLLYQYATTEGTLHVDVLGVADAIPLEVSSPGGDEDTAIPLDIFTELADTDGSESISVTIDGVPEGAFLSAGTDNGDGSWTLTTDQLDGLTITPPENFEGQINLDVTSTTTDVEADGEPVHGPETEDMATFSISKSVTIEVDSRADAPTLTVEDTSGYEDQPIALDISSSLTDTDGSETLSITISDIPEGAVLSAGTLNPDGSVTLQPDELDGLTITPPHDSNVDFTLTVTAESLDIASGEIAPTEASIDVTVLGVADEITLDAAGQDGNAGFEIPLDITTGITDTDGSETVSITISGAPEGSIFSAGTDNGDGTWTFTDADLSGLTVTPPAGYDGEMTLNVVATTTDVEPAGEGDHTDTNTVSGTITFEVDGESETPTLDLSDTTGFEDNPIDLDVQAALTDTDGSEVLSITISGVPDGAFLSAGEDLGDGSWLLTPDQLESLQVTPPADSNVDFQLTVTATASTIAGPGSEEIVDTADTVGVINVDVVGVADTPDLATQNATGDEDTAIALNIDASLIDVDESETLSITITGVPDGASLSTGIHDTETGTWTLTPDQLAGLTITPPLGSTDDFDLTVTATTTENDAGTAFDENGNDVGISSIEMPLHVNVLDVADQPELVLRDNVGFEDFEIPVPVHAALTDDSEVLSVSISGVPQGAFLSAGTYDEATDSWTVAPEDLDGLTVTPPPDSNDDFTLTVTATSTSEDGDIAETVGDIEIEVIGVADRPDLETQDAYGEEGVPIALDISAGLNDLDGSETLSVDISNVPDGAILAVDGVALTPDENGVYTLSAGQLDSVTVTAPPDSDGDFTLQVVARATEDDGDVAINAGVINVTVDVDNAEPPVLVLNDVQGVEDNAIPLDISATIASDDDVLSITISGVPEGAMLSAGTDNGNGSWTLTPEQLNGLSVTPPEDSNVNFDLTVTATAQDGSDTATTTGTLTVDVLGDADTPTLQTSDVSGEEGQAIALNIGAGLTDTDGSESLSITISGLPQGATLNAGTVNPDGSVTLTAAELDGLELTPPAGYDEDFSLSVTATATDVEPDGEAPHVDTASITGTIDVDMSSNAEPPTLVLTNVTGDEDSAIPLDINAAVTDADDLLSITISGVPEGAVLSAGTVNPDGSVTLTPDQLSGLTITPPADSNVDFDLTVTATAQDGDDTATTTGTLSVDVLGVADTPTLSTQDVAGVEDTAIALNIGAGLTDTDGSESLSITISGLPQGATLSAGTVNPDGSVTLTPEQLTGLTLTPPADSDEDFSLTVTATTTDVEPAGEGPHTDTASVIGAINVDLSPDADAPELVLTPAVGLEDNAIPLDISAALTDTDGSESLSITISDIPEGVVLSAGTVNPDGSVTLTPEQLTGLTATPPLNSDVDFDLTVTATSQDGGDTATTTGTLSVAVGAVADTPTVSAGDGDGDLGQTIPLDISSALFDTDGSESLSITIADVPDGAVINGGEQLDDGTWLLEAGDLANLTITLPAGASDDFNLSVTATATEADGGDQASSSATTSINVDPNAVDDTGEVEAGQSVGGNVLTNDTGSIEGANSVTDVTFGNVTKSFSNPDDVTSDDSGDYLLIEGEHGSLKMYGDGTYEYTADESGAGAGGSAGLTGSATPAEVEAAWSGVETFAFDFGTSYLNGDGKFDPSLADDSISFSSNGIGVAGTQNGMPVPDQINYDDQTGESEALGINLGSEATTAQVQFSNMYVNEEGGEQGRWQAFDADGNLVGEGPIDASTVDYDGSSNVGTLNIDLPGDQGFQYLVITPTDTPDETNPNDSSDFFVRSIEFEGGGFNQGDDLFTYTMADADGDTAQANLTINVDAGDVTAEEPVLVVDEAQGYEDSAIALDVTSALTDTDGSETLSITISDIPNGAVLSAGTINDDGSVTLTPDQLAGLTITPPHDSNVDFDLTVTATATETASGDTATTTATLSVDVIGIADVPPLDVSIGEGTPVGGDMPDFPPFDHAISNIVLYVADENGEVTKVKIDDFSDGAEAVHDVNDLDLAGFVADNYPGSDLLAMTVKAGNNHTPDYGPGEGELLIVQSGVTEGDLPVSDHADVTYDYTDVAGDLAGGTGGAGITGVEYQLDITTNLVDTDGSETLSINVGALPDGVTLSAGTENDDGSWTLDSDDLDGLTMFVPTGADTDFDVTVTSTTTENDGDTASVVDSVTVSGEDLWASDPILNVTQAQGYEDNAIALDVGAALTDLDGSETLSVTISEIPEGAVLSAGTLNDDGSVTLTADQLDGLTITPPADSNVDFNLTVTAIATESATGDTATVSASLPVDVIGAADEPPLTVSLGEGEYQPGEGPTGSVTIENVGDISAGYHNSYGYYTMDADGNPVAGEVIWADIKDNVGESFTIDGVDPSTIGFFLIPNGDNVNDSLADGLDVTFEQNENGQWVPIGPDGEPLSGQGAPALFSEPGLNPGGFDYMVDNQVAGNQNWEDLVNGGDQDFNDGNFQATTVAGEPGSEGTTVYPLDIATNLVDTDGSETLSITVTDLPEGAVLSAGTVNDDGSVSLTPAELQGLTLTVPEGTQAFDLSVTSTTTENDGDSASVTATVGVETDLVAEAPELDAGPAAGFEDASIALDISSTLTDTDGSETLSITVSDIPNGAVLSAGTLNDDGSVTLTPDQLDGLSITPPADSNVDFALTITATSTEASTGDTAVTTSSLNVGVTGVADAPPLDVSLGQGTVIEGTGETPEPTVVFSTAFDDGNNSSGDFVQNLNGWTTTSDAIEVWENGEQNQHGDGDYIELNDDRVDHYQDATNIMRDFPTEEGATYTLTFDYSPRPGYDSDVNAFEFRVDGETIGSLAPDGSGNSDNVWQSHTVTFVGTGVPMSLEFLTTGEAQDYGRGIRLDNIGLTETLPAETVEAAVEYPLDITTNLVDTDGSETLSITVADLPDGVTLSAGTLNNDGSVTLTAAELSGLTMTVPADTPAFDLSVAATTTENDGDSATVTQTISVSALDTVAEAPELSVEAASGLEDAAIALDIASALTDTDGSETLSITISGIPQGAVLSAGTLNDDGSVTLTPDQLDGLSITPPADSNADFDLTVTASSTESASGDIAVTTSNLSVAVAGVADAPELSASLGTPSEVSGGLTPVSYWRLDETSGNQTLTDSVGNNDGTPVNTLKTNDETGVFDGAAEFSGGGKSYNEEYIEVAHSDDLKPANGSLTLWFNADDIGGRNCLASSDSSGNDDGGHFGLWVENGQIHLRMQGDNAEGETNLYGGSVGTKSWNQVTVSWGDDGARIFLNGQQVAADPNWTRGLEGNENPWTFGANQWQSSDDVANNMQDFFNGHMDDIAIYDQPLDAEQAADLYTNGVSMMMENGGGDSLEYPLEISSGLTDTDGSESLSILVDGLPDGAELSAGTLNPDGSVSLTAADLDGLTVRVPADTGGFDLSISATSTEDDGDTSTVSTSVQVADEDQVIYGSGYGYDDDLEGGSGDDQLYGFSGDDTLAGGEGDDMIFGHSGNDVIMGGDGADTLSGGDGDDVIIGGAGDDLLTGGEGHDTFIFDNESGHDIITDIFEQDTLVFEGQEFHMDDLILSENEEGNVVVSFQGVEDTSVTLDGVRMDDMQSGGDSGYSVTENDGKVTITLDNEC